MRWRRDKAGALVPEKDLDEQRADAAAEVYEFDNEERQRFLELQRAMKNDRSLQKKVAKRVLRMQRAKGMSPTIKSRRK